MQQKWCAPRIPANYRFVMWNGMATTFSQRRQIKSQVSDHADGILITMRGG
jgi:hypothetical protein